jgi:hypothetical protein
MFGVNSVKTYGTERSVEMIEPSKRSTSRNDKVTKVAQKALSAPVQAKKTVVGSFLDAYRAFKAEWAAVQEAKARLHGHGNRIG